MQVVAIPVGYRFSVPFDDAFPQDCYMMGEERTSDYNGKPKPAVDTISNKPVWAIRVTDPSAKEMHSVLPATGGRTASPSRANGASLDTVTKSTAA